MSNNKNNFLTTSQKVILALLILFIAIQGALILYNIQKELYVFFFVNIIVIGFGYKSLMNIIEYVYLKGRSDEQ